MNDLVTSGLLLAKEVFQLLNTKEANKYLDRMVELEISLQKEQAKHLSKMNDKKIVLIKKELAVIMRAAIQQAQNARLAK